jgi:hypothetical protein
MAKKINQVKEDKLARKRQIYLVAIPLAALLIKVTIMANINAGAWLGADGENYLKGVEGLQVAGFFSDEPKLSFWPAGYPLLMWPFSEITISYFFYMITFVQCLFFAYATYFFSKQVFFSQLSRFAVIGSLFISFNPTLSLGTLAIGYESPVAACFLMVLGLSFKFVSASSIESKKLLLLLAQISGWFALMTFMQPRFLLVAIIFILFLTFKADQNRLRIKLISIGLIVILASPAILMFRNYEVIGEATISNNLGVTMAIGAGPETSGGYVHSGPDVPCESDTPDLPVTDNQKVNCVLVWYLKNPVDTLRLAYNKSRFFWSPWSGPLAEGTMARNPWLKIAPAYTVTKNEEGSNLVLGRFGKAVSYLWIFGQVAALFFGAFYLSRRGRVERFYSILLSTPVLISWLITIGTIGDHRFRVPTMSLSLMLQAVAFKTLSEKISKAT